MSNNSIENFYIIQSEFNATQAILERVATLYQPDDAILLMEDSIYVLDLDIMQNFKTIYVLEEDLHFDISSLPHLNQIHPITHEQWANLIAHSKKIITLK
ncbi:MULTISPECIES: DsrH/TusB family sulfur metabolism protein [unclassified Acinetobacter]|uniref:DsrH/TusB family sulfur metabolism protein n=1 Tax=unclassified Acinetobacter TaxID=196816 RepID=UPI0035BA3891